MVLIPSLVLSEIVQYTPTGLEVTLKEFNLNVPSFGEKNTASVFIKVKGFRVKYTPSPEAKEVYLTIYPK